MFCKNCGARIDDDALFCAECGARQEAVQPVTAAPGAPAAQGKKGIKKLLPLIIAGSALLVALAVVLVCVFAANSPKRVAKAAMSEALKVFTTGADAERIYSFFPKKLMQLQTEADGLTYDDVIDLLQYSYNTHMEGFRKKYPNAKISYKVEVDGTDEFPETTLEKIDKELSEEYGIRCTDATEINLRITLSVNGHEGVTYTNIIVYKIDGKWSLYKWLPSLVAAEDKLDEMMTPER